MHNPDNTPTGNFVQVKFTDRFVPIYKQPKLADLIQTKADNHEYFYGIELSAKSNNTLDYQKFAVLPLFMSLVWFGDRYSQVEPITDVDSVRLGNDWINETIVMPHFTSYRATSNRLKEFLALNYSNVLALRGDLVEAEQPYQHACDLVAAIRQIRGDTISIAVGGYPQGHPQAKSIEVDLEYLKNKVNAGADFIITQICFDATSIIEFIGNCRKNEITVPIVVGVFVPQNYHTMKWMLKITQVSMSPESMDGYRKRRGNETEFREYAVEMAGQLIKEVFESDVGVYGVQFFSMNHFDAIEMLVNDVIAKYNKK